MTKRFYLALSVFVGAMVFAPFTRAESPNIKSPNIVLILVDDGALMDFGSYGGEAQTPHIDALAKRGAVFTQYRTSPLCSPTRAMLLTGIDNHKTGVATIAEVIPAEHVGQPGYSLSLEPNVLTLADRLRVVGYRTLMSGKWHLGETSDKMPNNHGFDRSFALGASGADNWEDRSYMPFYADAPWFEDGVAAALPSDFYSSRFIVDKMMAYIEETASDKPFFAYLPFQAIHIPVQAPPEFVAKYKGRYDAGWHALREARHKRAIALGLVGADAPLAPMHPSARQWDSLSDAERREYATRMEVNAAMIEAMDFHIGRFVDFLRARGELANTVFVVTSDNGPEPSRADQDWRARLWWALNDYHIDNKDAGGRGYWGFIGPEWASAAASPSALFKFYATEGGVRAPLIISGAGIAARRVDSPAMVTDIAPTLLEFVRAGVAPAGSVAMTGRSLLPVLRGERTSVYGADDVRAIETSGNTALYLGDYKITRSLPPLGDGAWRLFHIVSDPGETRDLSDAEPAVLERLLGAYDAYAAQMGVLEMPAGFNSFRQIQHNTQARVWANDPGYALIILAIMLGFAAPFIYLAYWLTRKGIKALRLRKQAT